jgi:hypothetical protein
VVRSAVVVVADFLDRHEDQPALDVHREISPQSGPPAVLRLSPNQVRPSSDRPAALSASASSALHR